MTIQEEYVELRKSGMMYEFFPKFTGVYEKDKQEFSKFWWQRENNKIKEI